MIGGKEHHLYSIYDIGPLKKGVQRGLEMEEVRDLKVPRALRRHGKLARAAVISTYA